MEDQQMPGTIVHHPSSARGTSNATIVRDLRASLAVRRGLAFDGTVGGFFAAVYALGVTNDMPFSMCEFGVSQLGNGFVTVDVEEDGVAIREGR
jgi:hypothetical protein